MSVCKILIKTGDAMGLEMLKSYREAQRYTKNQDVIAHLEMAVIAINQAMEYHIGEALKELAKNPT